MFRALLVLNEECLNYTCGDPTIGLLGELNQGEAGLWTATQITLERNDSGFSITESAEVVIANIQGTEPQ